MKKKEEAKPLVCYECPHGPCSQDSNRYLLCCMSAKATPENGFIEEEET